MRSLYRSIAPAIRLSIIGLFLYALGAAATASAILLPPNSAAPDRTAAMAIAAAAQPETGTLVLAPQDTFINTNNQKYSTATTLATYTWPDYKPANAILMQFDLSALPAGAVVIDASLQLALVNADATVDPTYAVSAHKIVGKNPDLTKATGYKADGVNAWTASNCCSPAAPLAQADISPPYDTQLIDKAPGFKAWTLTTIVQEWRLNPATNFGVLLNSDALKLRDRYRTFASTEHADASLRPFLRITFVAADAEPPVVAVTAPSAGEVAGLVSLSASASDNVGVAGVQFHLNGAAIGPEQAESPHVLNWDSTAASDGAHSLTAVARDTSGNVATSLAVPVVINNGMLVLSPQDTSLNINSTNHSTDTVLMTYTWPDYKPANAILMKFDLSPVPPAAVVHEATLVLALVQSDLAALDTYTITASKVVGRNPVIAQATGYLAAAATSWTPNACCHDGVPLAQSDLSAPPHATAAVNTIPGFKSWTITTMVQEWVSDPATNFGLLLNSDTSKVRDRHRFFASMEHPVPTLRPALRVTFSVPAGDTTPPQVAIMAPAPGQTLSNVAAITATAADNVGVVGVQLHLDGAPLGAELTTFYAMSWDTRTAGNGQHSLTAVARDAAGNATVSDPVSVVVANDTTAPVISGVAASGVTSSGATISWTTNEPSDSQVEYGPTATYGMLSTLDGTFTNAHSVTLAGLSDTTQYHFRVRSRDQAGNLATSAGSTFTTADGTAPAVSITSPAGGATVSGTLTVAAAASDNAGVAGVQFTLDGANLGAEDTSSPYSASWNTTTVADGSHTVTAVARDAAGNLGNAAPITVDVSNAPPPPPPGGGLAALYPGDVGIENDPNVVFVERFDESTMANLFGRWTDVLNGPAMSFSTDAPAGSPVGKSLTIPWSSGNSGGHLYRQLSQGVDDTLYVRYYVKHPSVNNYQHSGIWMGGYSPALGWPNPQAGVRPQGNDRFSAAAEQNGLNRFDHYNYWMGMRASNDGMYWGNHLLNDPGVQATGGEWMCVEQMVKLNAPVTSSNGEHAIWVNGVNVSHLGQGFPNGSWAGGIFTQNPGGTPFQGFQWRNNANLTLNWLWLQVFASNGSGSFNYAHVVAAKSYIGCLASGSPSPTPPTVSMTAPAAGATVSGTIAVSANASDSVGVAGVQFKLDGASLGAEDTTAPYSVSLNTTTVANGSHTLTAVARNTSGLTSTASPRTVTVSNGGGSAWPNEPTGMTLVSDWGLDQVAPVSGDVPIAGSGGWKMVANASPGSSRGWTERVLDPTAPFSPSLVYDFVYPAGMVEGNAPSTVYYDGLSANEVYVGFWWKASSPFDYGPNGNKIAFIFNGGGGAGGQQFLILHNDGRLHVLPEYPGDYQWRTPNINPTVVTLGQWHRIEWYTNRTTGTLKWWLDGVLQGSYTNVTNSFRFDMFQFSPTWGGNIGAQKNQTDHYWFDHAHLSKR